MGLARKQIANAPVLNDRCKILTLPLTVGQAALFAACDAGAILAGEPNEAPLTGILISNRVGPADCLIGTSTTAAAKGIMIALGDSLFIPIAEQIPHMTYECASEVDVMLFFE